MIILTGELSLAVSIFFSPYHAKLQALKQKVHDTLNCDSRASVICLNPVGKTTTGMPTRLPTQTSSQSVAFPTKASTLKLSLTSQKRITREGNSFKCSTYLDIIYSRHNTGPPEFKRPLVLGFVIVIQAQSLPLVKVGQHVNIHGEVENSLSRLNSAIGPCFIYYQLHLLPSRHPQGTPRLASSHQRRTGQKTIEKNDTKLSDKLKTPVRPTVPKVGLNAVEPHRAAGYVIDPAVSEPIAKGTKPAKIGCAVN
ncbi:50S ribosomal protein L6 [Striga asiatica]|uniref:50S ribosomal protein L6 n=1 Tax=Striga asiatica TaxID=4170 RepID=A0A5A7QTJ3_STRAF|nr:50S ribosomal protein L6 [Striga asiatica]